MNDRFRIASMKVTLAVVPLLLHVAAGEAAGQIVYRLNDCVQLALERSESVNIAERNLESSRQEKLGAYGSFLPTLNLGVGIGRTFSGPTEDIFTDAQGRPIDQTGFNYDNYSFRISSNMPIFRSGQLINNLLRSREEVKRSEADLDLAKFQNVKDVINAYYELVLQINLVDVEEDNVKAAERNLERAETFYRLGSSARVDVLSAKVRLSNTELSRITVQNQVLLARVALANLIQINPDADWTVDLDLITDRSIPTVDDEISYAMDHRPDLKSWEYRVRASQHGVRQQKSQRYPTVGANFFYTWTSRESPGSISQVFDTDYNWGLSVGIDWNVFDRFQSKSAIGRAEATLKANEHNLKLARDDAVYQIRQIILNMKEALAREENSRQTVAEAEENLRLAEERYQVGAGTILEVNDAQVNLTRARGNVVRAQTDFLSYRADLALATGRKDFFR